MKRVLLMILILTLFLVAFQDPTPENPTYQDVFKWAIVAVVAFAGSPVTMLFKNLLSAIFKKPVEDRPAIILTVAVASGVALLELWLTGVLDISHITVESFPGAFFMVVSATSLYYAWMKGSEGFFGRGGLLKNPK